MGGNVFVSHSAVPPQRWRQAFPEAAIVHKLPSGIDAETLLWLHNDALHGLGGKIPRGIHFVVLHDEPSDEKGLAALSSGAVGYAHAHAAPQLLRTIESVVRNQGVWVGESLLGRLARAIGAVTAAPAELGQHPALDKLSGREREVAVLVGQGESNKEIARRLDVSERTVKAHLTAIFDKLGVRDRLQLAVALASPPG